MGDRGGPAGGRSRGAGEGNVKAREMAFLAVGLGVGSAISAWLAGGGVPPDAPAQARVPEVRPAVRREDPPPVPPAPQPLPAAPAAAAEPASPAPSPGELEKSLAAIEIDILDRELQALGGSAAPKASPGGYAGNPFAGKDPSALAELREEAERKVEELLERWRAAAPGKDRAAAMRDLRDPMRRLLETGGSMDYLRPLEEAAERGETAAERGSAMIATHTLWQPEVVDFLLARARSPHPEVRLYAVEGLAWVRGAEAARASEGVLAGIEDADPKVRAMAAASIAVIERRADRAAAIRDRIAREEDPGARKSMEEALRRLEAANAGR